MKTAAIRLANSFLLICKTESEVSIGVISKHLQKKVDSDLILTPIVNYNYDKLNNKIIPKSNFPNESEDLIIEEISFLFKTKEEMREYLTSFQTGTRIFLYNLKEVGLGEDDSKNKNAKITTKYELIFDKDNEDIYLNTPFEEEFAQSMVSYIDISFKQYMNFFRLTHKKTTNIFLFGKQLELENPYYSINLLSQNSELPTKIVSLNYDVEGEEKKKRKKY